MLNILILICIVCFIVYWMKKPKANSSNNSNSTGSNGSRTNSASLGIDLSKISACGAQEIMYLFGCIAYYTNNLHNDFYININWSDNEVCIIGSFEDLCYIHSSSVVPQELSDAINAINWSTKDSEKLEMRFPVNGYTVQDMNVTWVNSFKAGVSCARRCSSSYTSQSGEDAIYKSTTKTIKGFLLVIQNRTPSQEYAHLYERIF